MNANEKLAYVKVADVVPNPYQPRKDFDQRALEGLAESIDNQGLLQPILVREVMIDDEKKYELVAGERRLRAVRDILGIERIKAIVQVMSDNQSEEAALVENIQRQDLNVIEEARAILAIIQKEGLTHEQAAKRLGKSRSDVSNLVRLVRLPEEVQKMCMDGTLSRPMAFRLVTVPSEEEQVSLAKKCVEHGWTYDKLKKTIEGAESTPSVKKVRKTKNKKRERVSVEQQTKNLVMVEFGEDEAAQEFVAYMLEQGYKCMVGADILNCLNDRLLAPPLEDLESDQDDFPGLEDDNEEDVELEHSE